jgi:AraC family transcriptional regulator of arabinose operon
MIIDSEFGSGIYFCLHMHYDGCNLRWENRRIHTADVVFGEVLYEPGGVCGPRVQRDFELVVLHSGDCRLSLNGATRALKVGMVYLLAPGGHEHFVFSANKETHHSFCSIHPGFMPRDMERELASAPFSIPCSDVFRLLLMAVFKLRSPRLRATANLINQFGVCAFAEFLNGAHDALAHPNQDPAVLAFLHHIEDRFAEPDCLRTAHHAAGISRNALIYKLNRELRTTPARYLWKFRVERGAAMLSETGHTIAEIAYRCGFKNPFHFSRMVRKHCGQSPQAIRRQLWFLDRPKVAYLPSEPGT